MSSRQPTALASGYVALDVVQADEGTWLRAGGTAANVAAMLAYFGWKAGLIGVLGNDDAGTRVKQDLSRAGVETGRLKLRPGVGTPLVLHQIGPAGHRFRFGCAECGRAYRPHRPPSVQDARQILAATGMADVYFFDRPTASSLDIASSHQKGGKLVVYEPGTEASSGHKQAAGIADIVKFSSERLPLFGKALPRPQEAQLWVETAGPEGASFRIGAGRWRTIPAYAIDAVDPGGAGDWMTAAIIAGLPRQKRWTLPLVAQVLRRAQAIAALSCLLPGARTLATAMSPAQLNRMVRLLQAGQRPTLHYGSQVQRSTKNLCPRCHLPLSA
jgi:fructokinase